MTKIERLFVAAIVFNTNLLKFLPPYHVIISNIHICFFKGMISHMHRHAPKTVSWAQNFVY